MWLVPCAAERTAERRPTRRTNNLIIRLLHVTWITAALPSVCELLDLITFVTMSTKTSVFIACVFGHSPSSQLLNRHCSFHLMSPKLYSMSMLYTLNACACLMRFERTSFPAQETGPEVHERV